MSFYSEFAPYYEQIFPFRENVFSFLKKYITEGGLILDAGCGTGHYCGKFSEEGYSIIGVDLDEEMISFAKRKYQKARFFTLNLLDIDLLLEKYSFVYSIGNVVSHLNPKQLSQFFEKLSKLLSPKCHLVIQIVNWDFIIGQSEFSFPDRVFEESNITFKRSYSLISNDSVNFNISLLKDKEIIFKETSKLFPITKEDIQKVSEKSGFDILNHYSEYNYTDFDVNRNSGSIYVLRKI